MTVLQCVVCSVRCSALVFIQSGQCIHSSQCIQSSPVQRCDVQLLWSTCWLSKQPANVETSTMCKVTRCTLCQYTVQPHSHSQSQSNTVNSVNCQIKVQMTGLGRYAGHPNWCGDNKPDCSWWVSASSNAKLCISKRSFK